MKRQRFALLGLAVAVLGYVGCESKETIIPPDTDPLQVAVSPESLPLQVGQSAQLVASVTGGAEGVAKTVNWSTSDAGVASISANGNVVTVTGVAAGVATITATATADASVADAAVVTVTDAGGGQSPSITIKSITFGATNVPVNENNVFGQIEITLNLDVPQGATVNSVKVLANDVEIYSQDISGAELAASADEAQSSVELVASWTTNEFDRTLPATVGTRQGKYANGPTEIKAQVIGSQGTIEASTSRAIVLNNVPFVFARMSGPTGANCTLSAGGVQWCGGDVVFDAVGVSFSGNANDDIASLSLTGTANSVRNVTDNAAPFQLVLQKATTPGGSSIAGWEFAGATFAITGLTVGGQALSGCVVTDATPTPLNLNCGLLGGQVLLPNAPNIDNVAPTVTLFDLTPATLGCAPAVACYISGLEDTPPFSFAVRNGFFTHTDAGVGSPTATFMAGEPGSLIPVTSGADLPESVVAGTYIANATSCDALNNCRTVYAGPVAATPLTSATGAQMFGVDSTRPTSTVAGVAVDDINNFALPTWTISFSDGGVGPSGFSATPVSVQLKQSTPTATTCYTPDNPFSGTTVNCTTSSGAVNYQSDDGLIDIDVTVPGTGEGYWQIDGFVRDQAGNASTPNFGRTTLNDMTNPVIGGISGPSSLPGGTNVTFTAGLGDNVDLLNLIPSITYTGPFQFQFPTVTLGAYGVADGLVSNVTGSFTAVSFMRSVEGTDVAGRANTVVGEAQQVDFDVNDVAGNTANSFVDINPAVQFAAGGAVPSLTTIAPTIFVPANPAHGNFLHLAPSEPTVCSDAATETCASPRATVLSATMTGPNATFANPFTRVEFYYQDPVSLRWHLIGTGAASASDNTVTSTRTWTYTVTWTVSGLLDSTGAQLLGAINVMVVGVHSSGSALITNGSPQAVTLVSD